MNRPDTPKTSHTYDPVIEHVPGVGPVLQGLPARPRMRALVRIVPSPAHVAALFLLGAFLFTGQTWAWFAACGLGLYGLAFEALLDRYATPCQTADHWLGDDDRPDAFVEQCPYCTPIPLRTLWKGGRR